MSGVRDFPDLGISTFADAASVRICGTLVVEARQTWPDRSFAGVGCVRISPEYPLQADQTNNSQDKVIVGQHLMSGRYSAFGYAILQRHRTTVVHMFTAAKICFVGNPESRLQKDEWSLSGKKL